MPLFKYSCEKCHKESEILIRGEESPICPHCGSKKLTKQLAAFSAQVAHRKQVPSTSCCNAGGCSHFKNGSCPGAS